MTEATNHSALARARDEAEHKVEEAESKLHQAGQPWCGVGGRWVGKGSETALQSACAVR